MHSHVVLNAKEIGSAPYRVLTVQAHADDETITMGGTIALCHDAGIATAVVCCTDGKRATIFAPDMPEETTRPRLAEIRQDELLAACRALGVSSVYFLNHGDSNMPGHEDNHKSDAFWQVNLDTAVGGLVRILREFRPHIAVTYNAFGSYGHPDHIQAHRLALLSIEAARHPLMYPDAGPAWNVAAIYYTAFPKATMRTLAAKAKELGIELPFGRSADGDSPLGTPDDEVTDAVSYASVLPRKVAALRAHRSQIPADWPMLALLEGPLGPAAATEYFTLMSRYPGTEDVPSLAALAGASVLRA